jgi:hypothetical protein
MRVAAMKSLLDPSFVYVDAAHTDIRRTFARVRREQAEARKREQAARAVVPIHQQQQRRK